MEQNPSSDTSKSAASQDIPHISTFTSACHMSPSWARSIQSMFPHPTSGRSIVILFSHLCSSLPSGLFPPGFPPKPCLHLCCPSTYCMPGSLRSSWFYRPIYVLWGVQIIKLLVMYFSPLPCYLVLLRTKYLPQHPIHRHPQPIFLPQ